MEEEGESLEFLWSEDKMAGLKSGFDRGTVVLQMGLEILGFEDLLEE